MKFKHIFFSGICFFVLFVIVYWLFERLNIVPTIYLTLGGTADQWEINNSEQFLVLLITFQGCWIVSQWLYYKKVAKMEIE